MRISRGRPALQRLLQVAVSIGFLFFLFRWIEVEKVKETLATANFTILALVVPIIVFNRVLMSGKWALLLRALDVDISWWESLRIYYISGFVGLFLPATVGGDTVRAVLASKKSRPEPVISSIAVERLLGAAALLFMGTIGICLFMTVFSNAEVGFRRLLGISVLLFGGLLTLFALSLRPSVSCAILSWLERFYDRKYTGKAAAKLEMLYRSYLNYRGKKGVLFWFFLLTCLETLTFVIRSYVVAVALNANAPFFYFIAFVSILLILIRLPLSIDGFGIYEGGFVYFLALVGIQEDIGFSVGVLNHAIGLVALLPGCVLLALSGDYRKSMTPSVKSALELKRD